MKSGCPVAGDDRVIDYLRVYERTHTTLSFFSFRKKVEVSLPHTRVQDR